MSCIILLVRRMKRAILLQIEPTTRKETILSKFNEAALSEFNLMLAERQGCKRIGEFHHKVCHPSKDRTGFNIQIVTSFIRDAWKKKGGRVRRLTTKFNVPRNCKTFSTRSLDFVELGIYPRKRVAVPLVKNRNFQRYSDLLKNGWTCKTYGLTTDLQIVAYLSKDDAPLPHRKNVLGIDINAKHFAISVLSPKGEVLYQTYFGRHIYAKRKKVMERRAKLQSYGADSLLRRLRTREGDFVKTNLGQVVKEIINLAIRFDADIAIENLKRFKSKGRKYNKEVMKIPFYTFRQILSSRCFDNNITLNIVDSWHTSKCCSHCGAVARSGHSYGNYALFRCKECGAVVNSDRNASRNIAMKSLLERNSSPNQEKFQISNRQGLVNGLLLSDEVGLPNVAVQHANHSDGKPTRFGGG
jgi:IS605 OrfB family transposase